MSWYYHINFPIVLLALALYSSHQGNKTFLNPEKWKLIPCWHTSIIYFDLPHRFEVCFVLHRPFNIGCHSAKRKTLLQIKRSRVEKQKEGKTISTCTFINLSLHILNTSSCSRTSFIHCSFSSNLLSWVRSSDVLSLTFAAVPPQLSFSSISITCSFIYLMIALQKNTWSMPPAPIGTMAMVRKDTLLRPHGSPLQDVPANTWLSHGCLEIQGSPSWNSSLGTCVCIALVATNRESWLLGMQCSPKPPCSVRASF